jgi:hypothetical protein
VTRERYVLLGLAPARAPWFEAVARWTTSAAIAAEFVKCVSADEVRVRLTSGRRYSALLVDTTVPSLDRDLVDTAVESLAPVIVVRSGPGPSFPPSDLGVAAELPGDFGQDELMEVLAAHCQMIGRADRVPPVIDDPAAPLWLAQLFTVCGPGGTGASTMAMALAQGLSGDARNGRRVLLADLGRRADQAMLHYAPDLGPGVQELVEAHRLGRPEAWAALRPRAIDAAIEGVRRAFQVVVADVTGDLEGEADGGSMDVEERNHLARAAVLRSTVVVAVGSPGMKGVHSLGGLIRSVGQAGVPAERIVAVMNRSPRNPRARAESARALAAVLSGAGMALASPVAVPERKLEDVLRQGAPLPSAVVSPLVRAVQAVADRQADVGPPLLGPTRVQPGSLGTWADPEIESGTG